MKHRIAALGLILSGMAGGAMAETGNSSPDATAFKIGSFDCMSLEAYVDHVTGAKDFRINNFSVVERPSYLNKGLTVLEVAYSVANRKSVDVQIDGQFFLLEDPHGGPLAVVNASPVSYQIQAGRTDTAKGGTFVAEGTLKRAKHMCLHVVGDFTD